MNTKFLAGALVLTLASTSSFAASASAIDTQASVTTSQPLTRGEVRAELARARAAGELNRETDIRGPGLPSGSTASSGLTRAEVRAEVIRARAAGEFPIGPEFAAEANQQPFTSTRSRAEVRAEAIEANRDRLIHGTIDPFTSEH